MGRIPGHPSQRGYTLQHMWERHHVMKRLILQGYGNREIAARMGCTPQNVSDCRNSPIMQDAVGFLREEVDEGAVNVVKELELDAPKSLRLLQEIRDNEENNVRLRFAAAKDLLDRAGHGKINRVEGKVAHAHILQTDDEIEALKERGRAAKEEAINAEFTVETSAQDAQEVTDAEAAG